ncbi:GumC family protein [Crocosphaera sp.]|uniref:GumC family protein n=1 Tax=Crocosphaera sp. TaxID=2729996 RepID=UPI003F2074F6|nr:polysaccharide biosynthesis tyrosine autokinase [Crocosphaera sp.]
MTETNFSSLLAILKRRQWLGGATFLSVIAGAVAYLVLVPPQYKVTTKLMINERQVGVAELGQNLSELSGYRPGEPSPIATQAELVKSKNVLGKTVNTVFPQGLKEAETPISMKVIKKKLQVKIVPETNILEIHFKHPDPETSAQFVNEITQTLVAENIKTIRSQATAIREFLEQEIPKQQKATEAATLAENQYRQDYGLVAEGEQTSNLVDSLGSLENQERTIIAQLQNNQRKTQEIQQLIGLQNTQKAYLAGQVAQDETLRTLQNKLVELEISIANARSRFTESHPTVLSLVEEQEKVVNLYQQELNKVTSNADVISTKKITNDDLSQNLTSQFILSQIEGLALQEQLKTLQIQQKQLKQRLDKIPNHKQNLSQLVRKREEAVNTLKFLEGKLGEARLTEAQLLSNVRILELAEVDPTNKTPSKKVILLLAGFVGMIFATGMILLQEILDDTLYKDFDVERLLNVTFLGELPMLKQISLHPEHSDLFTENHTAIEPYRRLFKTLELTQSDGLKSIIISSAMAGEGTSLVSSHLGVVAAMLSRRTLLIDTNLYNPQLHEYFGLNLFPGLSDIIDSDLSISDLVQVTNIKNLSLLSCGQFKSNPYYLLETEMFKSFLQEAQKHYDLIIFDTPCLSDYTDAITLQELSDSLVMVSRPKFTSKTALQTVANDLQKKNISITGIIFNGVN